MKAVKRQNILEERLSAVQFRIFYIFAPCRESNTQRYRVLPFVLHSREAWTLSLWEEYKLRLTSENEMPRRIFWSKRGAVRNAGQ
jgi:hypothetical protein